MDESDRHATLPNRRGNTFDWAQSHIPQANTPGTRQPSLRSTPSTSLTTSILPARTANSARSPPQERRILRPPDVSQPTSARDAQVRSLPVSRTAGLPGRHQIVNIVRCHTSLRCRFVAFEHLLWDSVQLLFHSPILLNPPHAAR